MAFARRRRRFLRGPVPGGPTESCLRGRPTPRGQLRTVRTLALFATLCALRAAPVGAQLTSAQLQVSGARLTIYSDASTTDAEQTLNVGEPARVRTCYGTGSVCGAAPSGSVPGLKVVGDLSGPELPQAVSYETAPGGTFLLPGFQTEGDYVLSNVRLVDTATGRILANAEPPLATLHVRQILVASATITRLTLADLQARGISVTQADFNAYRFSIGFLFSGTTVSVELPVLYQGNGSTTPLGKPIVNLDGLPPAVANVVARWEPPRIVPFQLPPRPPDAGAEPVGEVAEPDTPVYGAILLPGGVSFLNQFFDAKLVVANGAPGGSGATLRAMTGAMRLPAGDALRLASTVPPVAPGQKLPLARADGASAIGPGEQAFASWTVEGLLPGTHVLRMQIEATLARPGRADVATAGSVQASVEVVDARFQLAFNHPDVVRSGEPYSLYVTVTNLSRAAQNLVSLDLAAQNLSGAHAADPADPLTRTISTLDPGASETVEFRLVADVTGACVAASFQATGGLSGAIHLRAGVGEAGIPLSPATLVLPRFTNLLPKALVDADARLLGLAYSLATAPAGAAPAGLPHVLRSDVERRAIDLGEAGQRLFLKSPLLESLEALLLDRIGNRHPLAEYDALRRSLDRGAQASSALAAALRAEQQGRNLTGAALLDHLADTMSYGRPWFAAAVFPNGSQPAPALEVRAVGPSGIAALANPSDTPSRVRSLPYGEVFALEDTPGGTRFPLAVVGRLDPASSYRVTLRAPAAAASGRLAFVVPSDDLSGFRKVDFGFLTMAANDVWEVRAVKAAGDAPLTFGLYVASSGAPVPGVGNGAVTSVSLPPFRVIGAVQDPQLDAYGLGVSYLFNRPPSRASAETAASYVVRSTFHGQDTAASPATVDRVAVKTASAAYWQPNSERVVDVRYQSPISALNGIFESQPVIRHEHLLVASALRDTHGTPLDPQVPAIVTDPGRTGGLVEGRVLRGDGTPASGSRVQLLRWKKIVNPNLIEDYSVLDVVAEVVTAADGAFYFDFVEEPPGPGRVTGLPPDAIQERVVSGFTLRAIVPAGADPVLQPEEREEVSSIVRLQNRLMTVNVALLGRGSVAGRLVHADDGSPVPDGSVSAASTLFSEQRTTVVAPDGSFTFGGLPVGPITLAGRDAAGNRTYETVGIAHAGDVVNVVLRLGRSGPPRTGTVVATVTRQRSGSPRPPPSPAAAASVAVYSEGRIVAAKAADRFGTATFRDVPAGRVTVQAADFTFSRTAALSDFTLAPDAMLPAALVLYEAAPRTVTGRVLYHDGPTNTDLPVAGAVAFIAGPGTFAYTDVSGAYRLDGVPVQGVSDPPYVVTAIDSGRALQGQTSLAPVLDTGDATPILAADIILKSMRGGVDGVVLDPLGRPFAGAAVNLDPTGSSAAAVSGGDGRFSLNDLAVGGLVVYAHVGNGLSPGRVGYFGSAKTAIVYGGHRPFVSIRLAGSGIVNVRTRSGGAGVPAPVRYSPTVYSDATLIGPPLAPLESATDADGKLTLELPVGGFTITALNALNGNKSAGGRIDYPGQILNVDLSFDSASTITGRVLNVDGVTPAPGADVTLRAPGLQAQTHRADANGGFQFELVPQGASYLTAAALVGSVDRVGSAIAVVTGPGQTVDVTLVLAAQGTVRGRVVDVTAGGPVPLANAQVYLQESGYPNRRIPASGWASANALGEYEFAHVFAGGVTVVARDRNQVTRTGSARGEIVSDFQVVALPDLSISSPAGTLTVLVRDPDTGGPVADALVTLSNGDVTVSDTNGTATYDALTLGTYSIHAFHAPTGRAGLASGIVIPSAGASVEATVLLDARGRISGTMWDDAAKTVAVGGGTVQLTGQVNGRTWGASVRALASTSSDAPTLGRFLFDGLPPGSYALNGAPPSSVRRAAAAVVTTPTAPVATIDLVLEPVADRYVRLYQSLTAGVTEVAALPGDFAVAMTQGGCAPACTYSFVTSAPASPYPNHLYLFPNVLVSQRAAVSAVENVGEQRTGSASGTGVIGGGAGTAADPWRIVLRPRATVVVNVRDGAGLPAQADVTLDYPGGRAAAATDASGAARFEAIPSGAVYASARVASTGFGGTASGNLQFDDQVLTLPIFLGAAVSAHGTVYRAPAGDVYAGDPTLLPPEPGAVVTMRDASGQPQVTTTDSTGAYRFAVLRTGNYAISATDASGQALASGGGALPGPNGTDFALPPLVLDSSPPTIVSIVPPPGSVGVSRNAPVEITFSELLLPAVLPSGGASAYFRLKSASGSVPPGAWSAFVNASGRQVVRFAPAGLYESSTAYSLTLAGGPLGVRDLAGRPLASGDVGSNFTTSDGIGPTIVATAPDLGRPVDVAAALRFDFSEVVTAGPAASTQLFWQQSGSLDWQSIPITTSLTRGGYSVLLQPPTGVSYVNDSLRRRVRLTGYTDASGNPMTDYDRPFRVRDANAPHVDVPFPPTAPSGQLTTGSSYTLTPALSSLDDFPAGDVDRVEYTLASAGDPSSPASAPAFTALAPPWSWTFVASYAGDGVTPRPFPVWVKATDTSLNASNVVKVAMSVLPNVAPVPGTVSVAAIAPVAGTFYAGTTLSVTITGPSDPDGTAVTLVPELRRQNLASPNDPADRIATLPTQALARPAGGWATLPPVVFAAAIPIARPEGEVLVVRVTATDALGATARAESAPFPVAHDGVAPVVDQFVARASGGAAASRFFIGQKLVVELRARDAETAVKVVSLALSGVFASPQAATLVPGTNLYRTAELTVPATVPAGGLTVNATASATDWGGNTGSSLLSFDVSPTPDPYAPAASWLTPWEGGAWPAGYVSTVSPQGVSLLLRARVTDLDRAGALDVPGSIQQVQFRGPADAAGTLAASFVDGVLVAGTGGPGTGVYEALWNVPSSVAPGTLLTFQVRAVDAGANATTADVHVRAAAPRRVYEAVQTAVLETDAMLAAGGDPAGPVFLLDGSVVSLYPLSSSVRTLPSMFVYAGGQRSGATFTSRPTVLTAPEITSYASSVLFNPLALALTDAFGLGHGARVDVSAKGLLGSTPTQAMLLPGQTGASVLAGGAHAGVGSPGSAGGGFARTDVSPSGSTYGDVRDPSLPGGGGGYATGPFGATAAGGTGGGVVRILAGGATLHLAGDVVADGGNGPGDGSPGTITGPGGAGGSIRIVAGRIEGEGRVSASGGRGTHANTAGGGAGGRVALSFADPPAASLSLALAAAGGLNALDASALQRGGAGTIYVEELDGAGLPKAPGALVVSNGSGTPSWPTPFSGAQRFGSVRGSGTARLVFDGDLTVGPTDPGVVNDRSSVTLDAQARLLLKSDLPTLAVAAIPDGGSVNAGATLSVTYLASDPIGVRSVTRAFSTQAPATTAYADEPSAVDQGGVPLTFVIPGSQPSGPLHFDVAVTDRAGRVASARKTWTVVGDSTPPVASVSGLVAGGVYRAGQTVSGTVTATDDVAVTSVKVFVDGQTLVLSGPGPTYPFSYVVPPGLPSARDTTLSAEAADAAGNKTTTTPVALHLVLDAAPTLSVTGLVATPSVLPGTTLTATASVSDDVGVTTVVFNLSGAVVVADTWTVNALSGAQTFSSRLPFTLTPGQTVTLSVDANDTFGHKTTSAPVTYTILADTTPPTLAPVALTPVKPGDVYQIGDVLHFAITASDDVGIASVTATVNGSPVTVQGTPPYVDYTAPSVGGATPMRFDVTVRDYAGNPASASRGFTVQPASGGTFPTVQVTCPSADATLPSAYTGFLVTATATDTAGISKIEFYRPGDVTPFSVATPSSGAPTTFTGTSAAITLPATATPARATYSVRAYNTANNFTLSNVDVNVVPTVDVASATVTDVAVVRTGTVVLDTPRTFAGLIVLRGATVTHSAATGPGGERSLSLTVNGPVYVECGGTVDVSGRGYPSSRTYPGATGGTDWSGGSHIGASGTNGNTAPASTFGSVFRPAEAGGGALVGGAGGGVVRVTAPTVTVDGAIVANGTLSSRGGGGGSVWVTATTFGGSGSIDANGGEQQFEAGGGGAISVEYAAPGAATAVLSKLTARGGKGSSTTATGGAGTVLLKGPGSTYGTLLVDNKGNAGQATVLPSFGSGTAQAGTAGATVVMDKVAWPGTYWAGHWVEVRSGTGTLKGTWRIGSVTNSAVAGSAPGDTGNSLQDGNVYDGYLIYSAVRVVDHPDLVGKINFNPDAHTFGARFSGGQWQYDNNSAFIAFTPHPSDRVFATYKGGVSNIVRLTCPLGVCGTVNGMPVLQAVAGDITPNFDPFSANAGEIWTRDLVFSSSLASFTLVPNGAETIDLAPGDTFQGVYRLDAVQAPNGDPIVSVDPIRLGTGGPLALAGPTTPGKYLELPYAVTGTDVTVTGNVSVPSIAATNLTVKAGARLTNPAPTLRTTATSLTLSATLSITVEAGASVDVSGRGYPSSTQYPGATGGTDWSGGSHIGASGTNGNTAPASTFGSVFRPAEAGGGALVGGAGGGVVRVTAPTVTVDGAIVANGTLSSRGGGGGSVWVTATTFGGSGSIDANGGEQQFEAGGGGAISVEYAAPGAATAVLSKLTARGGKGSSTTATGGAGTVLLKGPGSTYGTLLVDNKGNAGQATVLPSFGSGTAQAGTAGATVVMDKVAWPGTYWAGHWVEVRSGTGTLKGTWRIGSVTNSAVAGSAPGDTGNSLQDGNVYDGYLIYSAVRVVDHPDLVGKINFNPDAHTFGARFSGGQWQYDNNSAFIAFTPHPSDRVFATYKGGVSNIVRLTCPLGVCGTVNGMPVLQAVAGDITPNFDPFSANAGEIWTRDLVFSSSLASFTLVPNGAETIDLAPGDTFQGVYRLDAAPTVTGSATLASADPVRVGGAVTTGPALATAAPPQASIRSVSLCDTFGEALKPGGSFAVCADVAGASGEIDLEISGAFEARIAGYGNCRDTISIPGSARPGALFVVATLRSASGRGASASARAVVAADELAPVLVSVAPTGPAALRSGEALRIAVETWDDVGIASVAIRVGDRTAWLASPPYVLDLAAPPVAAEATYPVVVEAFDPSGNVSRRASTIRVLPASAPAPATSVAAPGAGVRLTDGALSVDGGWPWRDADGVTRGRTLELPAIGVHEVRASDGAAVALDGAVARGAVHGGSVVVRRGGEEVGRYRIESVSEDGLALRLEAGASGNVRKGDFLEGEWAFDAIELTRGARLISTDGVQASVVRVDASSLLLSKNLQVPARAETLVECPLRGARPERPGAAPLEIPEVRP